MRQKCPAELNSKTIRIGLGDYALLSEISRRAGVTFAEALHLALERQEAVTKVSLAQTRMVDVVMPSQVTAKVMPSQVTSRVMPSQVTGNGAAHIQPKIIRRVS